MSVVSIRDGVEIAAPGEPDPQVVAEIERVLEMARSGELRGFVMALYWRDTCCSSVIAGTRTRSLIGQIEIAKSDIIDEFKRE